MKLLISFPLFLLATTSALAQSTHGFFGGISYNNFLKSNYSMYEIQSSWSTFSPDWGCQLGYRFDWSLTPKWTLGVGVAYSENYVEQTYHPYGYVDRIICPYAVFPVTGSYNIFKKFSLVGGYQFGYSLDTEINLANVRDHAGLLGVNYDLKYIQFRVIYQCSLNGEQEEGSIEGWDKYGNLVDRMTYTVTHDRLNAFQFLLYIPLNKQHAD